MATKGRWPENYYDSSRAGERESTRPTRIKSSVSCKPSVRNRCRDSLARYTCPHCNLRYCSVACFGAPSHSTCSESFYKNALLEDMRIEGSSNAPTHSQSNMLEILRNLEAGDEASSDQDNSVQSLELTQEQLDRLSKDELLELLTHDQITEFNQKLASGQLDPEFLEATINSQCQNPWWIACQAEDSASSKPNLLDQSLLPALSESLNPGLFYHILSVALGYVSLIRHYGLRSLSLMAAEDAVDLGTQLPQFFPVLFGDGNVQVESVAECFSLFLGSLPNMGAESIPFLTKDLCFLFPDSPSNSAKNLVTELAPDGHPIPQISSLSIPTI
ncbi:hypothetical protein VP01_1152g9 [Puccinia sorghi]|uniref:HIT-type domain-containing protein n=1 Tax=Puccinia sorghi TaxID=27349 RepID=A0A0L6VRZ1_9BASI|nr:hypothetical protein VP01_1152g9 [Puccinia sorghi]